MRFVLLVLSILLTHGAHVLAQRPGLDDGRSGPLAHDTASGASTSGDTAGTDTGRVDTARHATEYDATRAEGVRSGDMPRGDATRADVASGDLNHGGVASGDLNHGGVASGDPTHRDTASREAAFDGEDARALLRLVVDRPPLPGEAVRLGVHFVLDEGWHVYWKNPGDAAFATVVAFDGVRSGELQWPAPERFVAAGEVVTYGYAEETLLFAEATVSGGTLRADVDFLVCKVDCIPDRVRLALPLARAEPAPRLFERFAARIPSPAEDARFVLDSALPPGETAVGRLEVDCGRCEGPADPATAFLAERIDGVRVHSREVTRRAGTLAITLGLEAGPDPPSGPQRLRGVLRYHTPEGVAFRAVDVSLPRSVAAGGAPAAASAHPAMRPDSAPSLLGLLFLALLGGLILNLMPCVLPVLAVKAVGLSHLGGANSAVARRQAAGYTLGVVSSMLALAGAVVALRAAGSQVGWGFQLQQPRFVALLVALLVAFALGLFGVFPIAALGTRLGNRVDASSGWKRSVGEGVLAVLLATPCSAPLLGTAVGFALAADAPYVFLLFGMIGVGLAAPFVVLALIPSLRRRLPRPGRWTETLEHVLGFALLGTAIWLVWVLAASGPGWVARALVLSLLVAFACWLYGRAPSRRRARVAFAGALCGALLLLGAAEGPAPEEERLSWEPWSEEAVQGARAEGMTVFVDFTADWCVTCKVNEAMVLERGEVRDALGGCALFVADWTQRDDRIREVLARHGRGGVPLYLVYRPGVQEPEVLPEVLTPERVLASLRR